MYVNRFLQFSTILVLFTIVHGWKRYDYMGNIRMSNYLETRVLDCSDSNATVCTMELPKGVKQIVNCRREPIPESERTKLNKDATDRLACPVGCKIHEQRDDVKTLITHKNDN